MLEGDTGITERFEALGVPGVTVVLVAVVVEERGRDGIRDAGFEPWVCLD